MSYQVRFLRCLASLKANYHGRLAVLFPYPKIYPEQYQYMCESGAFMQAQTLP